MKRIRHLIAVVLLASATTTSITAFAGARTPAISSLRHQACLLWPLVPLLAAVCKSVPESEPQGLRATGADGPKKQAAGTTATTVPTTTISPTTTTSQAPT